MSKSIQSESSRLHDIPRTGAKASTTPATRNVPHPTRKATRLLGIGTAVPEHIADQRQISAFMQNVLTASADLQNDVSAPIGLLKRIHAHSGIEKRYSVISDYSQSDPANFTFYPKSWDLDPLPTTADRMALYEKHAVDLAAKAAREAIDAAGILPDEVTHLVISTCTGFFAPGPDVLLLRLLGIPTTAARTVLGFMGCYAGVSGMRACRQITLAHPDAVVLQIAIELCTLHYQRASDPQTIVSNAIFADGAAAAIYAGSDFCDDVDNVCETRAEMTAAFSDISPDSLDRMSWRIGDHGFKMTLDAGVPAILCDHAPAFVQKLADAGGVSVSDIIGWAIHPGGRKIIEAIQESLSLSSEEVSASLNVLRDYGNMSSATILFVLKEELSKRHAPGSPVAAMAFGPGLTMEGALFITR